MLVLVTGRPYAVSWALDQCAVIQAFVPGEEGAAAIAGVISGRVNPSGRRPVTLPRSAGAQPYSYLHPPLGGATTVSNLPTAPALPFRARVVLHNVRAQGPGHRGQRGGGRRLRGDDAGGQHRPSCGVRGRPALRHDVVASISRPTAQLLGYTRLALEPGESAVVRFVVSTTRLAFSDRDLVRVVEPGDVELRVGPLCEAREAEARVRITGQTRRGHARRSPLDRVRTSAGLNTAAMEAMRAEFVRSRVLSPSFSGRQLSYGQAIL